MKVFTVFIFLVLSLFSANYPFPQDAGYYHSSKITLYPKSELISNVKNYYDIWKRDFIVCKDGFCRVAFDKKDKTYTVSEGQGYGMMIVAIMAGYDLEAKKIFDAMYRFVKANPSDIVHSFMNWKVPPEGKEKDSAFDGDADIAYALLLADKQWGSSGKINYLKEAKKIINDISRYTMGKNSNLPLLGDWEDQNGKKYNQFTPRTSDFMLSHFRAFYRVTKDKKWLKAIRACQKALLKIQRLSQNKTELVSDFVVIDKHGYYPAPRKFLEEEDNSYYYNACRVPFRVGLDALLNNDKISRYIALKMTEWIYKSSSKNPVNIKSGYRLDGSVIGNYFSTAFVAPFGVSSKLDPKYQSYLNSLYNKIKNNHENYYEDSLNLISQLIMIDAFWDPTR